ncbi:MAG: sodium:proton antiporter [Desulfovibrio sp.]|nr:MAG: sodium:proton antiporter [Desulfovibrio sp.]
MEPFQVIAILVVIAAAFAYVNHRFLRMPMTVGLMFLALASTLAMVAIGQAGADLESLATRIVGGIDFSKLLLEGMLGLLLFAGALHVNLDDLLDQALEVSIFATLGVASSTFLVGGAVYGLSMLTDMQLPFILCLLFGSLISPTDPIAVLAIMNKAGAPTSLRTKITGESLFNDGIGVVAFLVIFELAFGAGHGDAGVGHVAALLAEEVVGGLAFGVAAGFVTYLLLKSVNNYQVEILLTLALVIGGYALATALHISGPLAMVAAGLLIGNRGRRLAMSNQTREHLDTFWELIDEVLNSLLFVLIGLEALVLAWDLHYIAAGFVAIVVALAARFISIGIPLGLIRRWRPTANGAVRIMTWGGLRGGISVALALSLPQGEHRDLLLTMTYLVVAFSILVQGLTIKSLITHCCGPQHSSEGKE